MKNYDAAPRTVRAKWPGQNSKNHEGFAYISMSCFHFIYCNQYLRMKVLVHLWKLLLLMSVEHYCIPKGNSWIKNEVQSPYLIPPAIVCQAGKIDASPSGWPEIFEPQQKNCELCNGKLWHWKLHPGMRGRSVLITNMHPFKVVKISKCASTVQPCTRCFLMNLVSG